MAIAAEESIRAATHQVATAMLPELPSIGRGTAGHITAAMPELGQRGVAELVLASCQANSSALLDALMRGVPLDAMAPSAEVMQTTRALVAQGVSHDAIMRAYQVGIGYWCERWARAVERHCTQVSLAIGVVSHGTGFLLAWLQVMSDRVSAEYRDEAERLAREGSMARAADVRRVLRTEELEIRAASLRLGYDLAGHHVALVLSRDEGDDATLEASARALAGTVTSARPLVVRVDLDTTWCWIPTSAVPELPAPHAAILVGQGRPGSGIDGFRASHREACEAVRVARLAGRPWGTVVRFEQVELASLCSSDAEVCRAFVTSELGPLAADTPSARRLRATLEAFYDANSNFRATAARLGLHHNTVRYRLGQAEALLGRTTAERRLQLELALHLAARL